MLTQIAADLVARLTLGARRRRMRVPETWPWAAAIVAISAKIAARLTRPCPPTRNLGDPSSPTAPAGTPPCPPVHPESLVADRGQLVARWHEDMLEPS